MYFRLSIPMTFLALLSMLRIRIQFLRILGHHILKLTPQRLHGAEFIANLVS
jgi:hypothetical protein